MKKYTKIWTLLAAAIVAAAGVSCQENLVRPSEEAYITLNPGNTYRAGEEVRFDINGNPDYIYFFPGELGKQYEYRDRTTIAMEDLEQCRLVINIMSLYGLRGGLDIYMSKNFDGLKGDDAMTDLATVQGIEASLDQDGNIPGWEHVTTFVDPASSDTAMVPYEFDITDYADNFALAFHWHPLNYNQSTGASSTQRTYRINIEIHTKFRGYDEVITSGRDLGLVSVSLNTDYIADPYYCNQGNGSVIFTSAYDINMQGVGADVLPYALNSWVITTPRPLNSISPDTGLSVKALADDIDQYAYTYEQPGTYDAVFMITNGNYQGQNRKVQHLTVTVVDPITGE
ncbi:MAG: DUF5017 domain-containing protein [Alistipes sp.]|nr:DUF5017 domain-containing protein [Alistipes sp.]